MKREEAIQLFGSMKDLTEALGITRSAVYQWPDELPQRLVDEIIGAAVRTGRIQELLISEKN